MGDEDEKNTPPSRTKSALLNRTLDIVGRTFVTVGLLMLAFVAYQLWGTGIEQAQSQKKLAAEFSRVTSSTVPSQAAQYDRAVLREGDVVGRISMPTLRVDTWIVAGSKLKYLEKGPGVFPQSAMPGHVGNFAVAGHRTSYGAPFGDIDKLRKGDVITVTSQEGTFNYSVTGSEVVPPTDISVLRTVDPTRAVATLITCHPKWTSSNRLVVHAELTSEQSAITTPAVLTVSTPDTSEPETVTPGWFHDTSRVWPTLAWSVALAAIWLAGSRLFRRQRREAGSAASRALAVWNRVGTYAAILSLAFLFTVTLYVMFGNLSGLLPANL